MEPLLAKLNTVASRVPYYRLSQSKAEKPVSRLRMSVIGVEPSKSIIRPQTRVMKAVGKQRQSENLQALMIAIPRGIRLLSPAGDVSPSQSHRLPLEHARAGRYILTLELPKIRTLQDHN